MWKLQEIATINLKIALLNTDGTPATGETTNLFTKIIAPSGEEVTGYTEAIFTEPASASNAGVYNVSFSITAPNKTFTLEDQANPYNVMLDSSTADVNPTTIDVWITSIYPWETAKEATLAAIKGSGWSFETLEEIMVAVQTRLASVPYTGGHAPATVTVTSGTTLSGDVSSLQTLNQVYLKVQESGKFQIDTTYTNIDEEHTTFYATYRYFGSGSSNHKVEARIWNYNTSAWDEALATTKDFPATDEDRTLEFTIPGTLSNYYDGSAPNLSAQLRIEHDSNFDLGHFFWLDTVGFGTLETIYTAPDNVGISTLNDMVDTETQKIISFIESHRGHHTATGNVFYWDPVNGHDDNDGLSPAAAKLTYDHADVTGGIHGLLTDSNHDLVIILSSEIAGTTEINEYVEIDTRYTFVRGMGRDIFINATHNEVDAVLLSAEGAEISGIRVDTNSSGSQNGIRATGDFAYIRNVWICYARSNGIIIDNASHCIVDDWEVSDAGNNGDGHGCVINGDISITERNIVRNGLSFDNDAMANIDGIRITGSYAESNFVLGSPKLISHNNTGWGINEVNGANFNVISGPGIFLRENTLGTVSLIGANSSVENAEQWGKEATLDTHETNRATMETTLVAEHDATQVDISNLDVPDNTSIATILSEVQNVTYGLSAIQTLVDALDTATELQARFDEIKGAGWTDETLKALKEFVDDLETRITQARANGMPPATMSRV